MKTCIFTIVSNNYLHYANTLFDSVKEHCSEADIFLGLCDKKTSDTVCPGAGIIDLTELDIKYLSHFIHQYTILELNTAIKPYVIEALMNKGYDKIIYIDPDIKIFDTLDPMLSLLDEHNVLLTPHLTNLLDDGKLPNELGILQAGSYNLGYIGLRTNDETRKLVSWWQQKLYRECVVDISRGLFVDQKWMDMVPSLFEGVYINRNEGWNVAYWNLNHRDIIKDKEGKFKVNGLPLTFFHYSGYSIEATTLSKHQTRFTKKSKGPALVELCEIYNRCLQKNNIDFFKKIPYAFSKFADGVVIPDCSRKLIRESSSLLKVNFFDENEIKKVHDFLNAPAKGPTLPPVLVTRLSAELWNKREDIQHAFPDLFGQDSVGYSQWLLSAAEKEAGFSDTYLEKIQISLQKYIRLNENKNTAVIAKPKLTSNIIKYIWNRRESIPLSVRLALGQNVANWAFRRANRTAEKLQHTSYGVNLIGYMQAESGVGEAARASLRGLEKSEIPFSVIDYRLGNISRMNENIGFEYSEHSPYSFNLIHVNADQVKIAKDHLGEGVFGNKYNIGYWYWEMPEFPEGFDAAFSQVDEVWVSSEYNLKAISARTNKMVKLIPPNIDIVISKEMTRQELGMHDDEFIFFHTSDVLSMHERKNPLAVVKAFINAFAKSPEKKVRLIVKISNLDKQPSLEKEIIKLCKSDPRINFVEGYMDRNTLNNVLAKIDCYVSLHRAEGFGLPIAEAMFLAKPVIATLWSGNTDFMDQENSLPVSYDLVQLTEKIGPYEVGQWWAEPNIDDAAEKMFCISENKELAKNIGEKASEKIRKFYSPKATANAIEQRINELTENI